MKIFWSYSKRDNPKPFNLTKLKNGFQDALGQCLGEDTKVFQDESSLIWGEKWRQKLEDEVTSSTAIVCILSPSYFASKMCIQEFIWAQNKNIVIYPILYRQCPSGLKSNFLEEADKLNVTFNRESKKLSNYQYKDFTGLRNHKRTSKKVLNFLDDACNEITQSL